MTPSLELKQRILEATRREPSPDRTSTRVRNALALAVGGGAALSVFAASGGLRPGPRPPGLIVASALGAGALAVLMLVLALGRGGSMLGRPRRTLTVAALMAPITLLAWKVACSARVPDMIVRWPERPGLLCLKLSTTMGLGLLLAFAWVRRASDPTHPVATGAALGATAGAWAWVLVDLWCPVAYPPHLILGHVLPVLLLTLVGAGLGWRVIALRRR